MSARVLRFPTATPPRHEPLCRADGPWGARASWPYPVSNWEIDFDTGKGFAVVRHVWVDGSPSEPLYGIAYETVGEVMDGRCRIALGGKVPPPASAWELLRCGCEHRDIEGLLACQDLQAAMQRRVSELAMVRAAAFDAPAGAFFVAHCDNTWPAAWGGACPRCGAAADVVTPVVAFEESERAGLTYVRAADAWLAQTALVDAGQTQATVRVYGDELAVIWGAARGARLPHRAADLVEVLCAKGWDASVRRAPPAKKTRTRKGGA
jgi:hypothetical protein